MSNQHRIAALLNPGRLSRCLPGVVLILFATLLLSHCSSPKDRDHVLRISVPEQKMFLYKKGVWIREYPVSTSKFGLGDQPGSKRTPLGKMEIAEKHGGGAPNGAVFKSRRWTGEILQPDALGRDPIVSRILWLKGTESWNRNAYPRYIYIHGTAEERNIGHPVSYGCVRMRSNDIIELYGVVGTGADVYIMNQPLPPADQVPEVGGPWQR